MKIARTIEIGDFSPEELAQVFSDMGNIEQAEFFAHIWKIHRPMNGAAWCMQSSWIAKHLDSDGRNCITKLAEWAADPEGLNA